MAEKIEMGLEAAIRFAQVNKSGDKEDRVGMQIANPNLVVQTVALKERMYRNPKSPLKEVIKHHDLTWLWIGVPFASRRTPSYELLVVEYSHGDEVFNGLLVAFRLSTDRLSADRCASYKQDGDARQTRGFILGRSLPRGMPKVVDYRQTDAQASNKTVTQDRHEDFIQVRPPRRRNTNVLRLICIAVCQ